MSRLFKRTCMCGEVTEEYIGKEVVINGWVAKARDLGGLIFCDVRDKKGIVQVVFNEDVPADVLEKTREKVREAQEKRQVLLAGLEKIRALKG